MATDYKFQGWVGLDKDAEKGKMVWQEYKPKTWTEDDVDIEIVYCGVCGTDLNTLRSAWGPTLYPVCVGHEITGYVVKVGKNVTHVKVGDRVGVGAQSGSCLSCEECSKGLEPYCRNGQIGTYSSKYPDGSRAYGGYADYCRAPGHFVIKIPDGIPLREAAPTLCGGVTTWNALVENGAGPGKKVGIVGIGGLGHFGLLWAKALGCDEVVAISRTGAKLEDARKLGITKYVATNEEGWTKKNFRSLDLIISTVSSGNMPLTQYLQLLKVKGTFIQIGLPDEKLPAHHVLALDLNGCKFGGASIGSPGDIKKMLAFAEKHHIHPMIHEISMKDANKAVVNLKEGKARFRYVLVNEKHVGDLEDIVGL